MKKPVLKIVLAVALTLGLLFFCFKQVDWKIFEKCLDHANFYWLGLAALGSVAIITLNSVQLKIFLPKDQFVPFSKMFNFVAVFSMVVNTVPFWGGHAVMLLLLNRQGKVRKSAALSVLSLDQIIEGFAKLYIFGVALWLGFFPASIMSKVKAFLVLVLTVYFILLTVAFYYRDPAHLEVIQVSGWRKKFLKWFAQWAHQLQTLRSFRRTLETIFLAVLMKTIEVLAIYAVQKSLGVDLGFRAAFLVAAALSLATTLPLTPGRLGLFEAAGLWAYTFLGIDASTALALALFIHVTHTLPFILVGYLASLKLGFGDKLKIWKMIGWNKVEFNSEA